MKITKVVALPISLLIGLSLGGCGGGGGDSPAAPAPVAMQAPVPVATTAADLTVVNWNQPTSLNVLANDSVTGGGALGIVSVTAPAHGTAVISGNTVLYTPTTGYFGQDSFSYTARSAAGGTTSSAAVGLKVNAKIVLTGKVTDSPLANAMVTAQVGTQTFNVTADANGNYSLPISSDSPDNFVVLKAQGVGTQANVTLASLAGDSQTLANATNADGSLPAAKLPEANITNVSTASYALVTSVNGGTVPTTQAALNTALTKVDTGTLLQMAAVIKLVADGVPGTPSIALPSGTASTLELVTNPATFDSYAKNLVATAPAALATATSAVLADQTLSTLPTATILATTSRDYYLGKGCCAGNGLELTVNPDGTATVVDAAGTHAATWNATTGPNVITYTQPVVQAAFDSVINSSGNQAQIVVTTTGFQIRQFSGSANAGVVSIASTGTIAYPNHELPDRAIGAEGDSTAIYKFSDGAALTAPAAADLTGRKLAGFPALLTPNLAAINQISLLFNADGTATSDEMPGATITWTVVNGKLVVDYGNGTRQSAVRLSAAADGEQHWLVRTITSPTAQAVVEAMVIDVTSTSFNVVSPVSRWLSSVNAGLVTDSTFYINIQAGNVGQGENQPLTGAATVQRPFSWQVDSAGSLVMTTYQLPNSQNVARTCPNGFTCTINFRRTWKLLRATDKAIFVFETLSNASGFSQTRINRYDGS